MGRGAGGVISLLCNSLFFVQCRRQKRHASSLLWEKSGVCWRSLLGREFLMNSGLSDVHFHRRLRIRTTTLRFPECKAPSVMCFHSSDQSSRLNDQLKAKLKADLWVSCSDQSGTPPAPKRGTAELIQPDQRTPPPRFHFQSGGNVSAGEQGFSLVVGLSLMTSSADENTEPPAFRLLPLSFAFVGQTFSECGSSGREPGRLCSSAAASALHLGLWIIKWLLFPTFLFCSCSPKKNAVNRVFLLPPSFFISLLHQTPRGFILHWERIKVSSLAVSPICGVSSALWTVLEPLHRELQDGSPQVPAGFGGTLGLFSGNLRLDLEWTLVERSGEQELSLLFILQRHFSEGAPFFPPRSRSWSKLAARSPTRISKRSLTWRCSFLRLTPVVPSLPVNHSSAFFTVHSCIF